MNSAAHQAAHRTGLHLITFPLCKKGDIVPHNIHVMSFECTLLSVFYVSPV